MKFKILFFIAILASTALIFGCGGEPVNNSANGTNTNTANNANSGDDSLGAKPDEKRTVQNNAPTLTPVFKAYCAAFVAKDDAALRKIYSKETIASFEEGMKADGINSLSEYLAADDVTNELCEVSNEVITGDTAVAQIKVKSAPSGMDVVFVKEGGEWKLTNRRPMDDNE